MANAGNVANAMWQRWRMANAGKVANAGEVANLQKVANLKIM